ncbi:PAS domain S-box protein [Thiomicrorhabdus sp.]|uniref:PAS domain S-box protein n=1 Tax=Thiomicrorhabdus sp. TaxID=2039724 RepID=UPI003566F63E
MPKQAETSQQKSLSDVLFHGTRQPLSLIDPKTGLYIDCNPATLELYSLTSSQDVIGKSLTDFSPRHQPNGEHSSERFEYRLTQTLKHDSEAFDWTFETSDGSTFSRQVLFDKVHLNGKKYILERICQDSETDYRSFNNVSTIRMNASENLASLGSWELDLNSNKLWWSDEIFRIFEIDPKQFEASYEAFINAIHPDDRDAVDKAYKDSLENHTGYQTEHRLLFKDGRIKYVEERCNHQFDASGKPIRSNGIVQDITQRKQVEILLQESEKKHRAIYDSVLDGILIANSDTKQLIDGNTAICEMLGYTHEELTSLKVHDIHPKADWPYVFEQFDKQARGEIKLAADMPVQRKDGSTFYTDINTAPIQLAGKTYVLGVFRDITERKQNEERFKLFRTLIDHSSDAIEVLDPESFHFLDVNETECQNLGYSREEMLSMEVFEIDHHLNKETVIEIESQIKRNGSAQFETVHRRKDGSTFPVEVRASVVALDKPYMISIARDITDQKIAEQKLKESELAYRTLTQNLPGLVYRVFVRENYHMEFYNDLPLQMTGYSVEELTNGEVCSIDPLIVDEDRPTVLNLVEKSIIEKSPFTVEYRLKQKTGEIRWMQEKGMPVFGEDGKLLYIDGVIFDITDSKKTQESLRQSEEKFRTLLESTSDWIWEINRQGIYTYVSPQVESLLGYTPQEVLGKSPLEFMPPQEAENAGKEFLKVVEKLQPIQMLENTNTHKDGRLKVLETSGVPYFDADGAFMGYRGIDRDITERKQAELQIQHMAHYDTLTNLPNRALFLDRLNQELARAKREQLQFALLFIDLDHFKEINDTLGHAMGDLLLQEVSKRLQASVRQMDTVARIGGDEFTVVITDIKTNSGAANVAQKIIDSLTDPFNLNGNERNIGCSIGIALYPEEGENSETLLKRADMAMYCAKKQRNTYRFFHDAIQEKSIKNTHNGLMTH